MLKETNRKNPKVTIEVGKSGAGGVVGTISAGLICVSLASIGLYVAIFGGEISGGILFAPKDFNQAFGRLMFGFGGLLTLGLGFWAFADARRMFRESRSIH
jgi:hypothetical protein